MKNRRNFLLGGSALALGAYSYHRGLRYPRLGFEPHAMPSALTHSNNRFELFDLIVSDTEELQFRAFAPEPSLKIRLETKNSEFTINNIAVDSILSWVSKDQIKVSESVKGITRTIKVESQTKQDVKLTWALVNNESVNFAVIGDTGGNTELTWCLNRAHELGAQFLLHLGDFNYGNGDYARAIQQFRNAPLPCYISIGNHDFNDSGLVYNNFRAKLGPLNHSFTVAGTRFINFDTGADFFPANGGLRGALIKRLTQTPQARQVFFTHRPLQDPRPGNDHVVGSINGVEFLSEMIKQSGGGPLLTGHVHHSAELRVNGIQQFTIGEGLGHEDILLQRQVAQLLMGRASRHMPPTFNWAPLNMPWNAHQSHTHLIKLNKLDERQYLNWYKDKIVQG